MMKPRRPTTPRWAYPDVCSGASDLRAPGLPPLADPNHGQAQVRDLDGWRVPQQFMHFVHEPDAIGLQLIAAVGPTPAHVPSRVKLGACID